MATLRAASTVAPSSCTTSGRPWGCVQPCIIAQGHGRHQRPTFQSAGCPSSATVGHRRHRAATVVQATAEDTKVVYQGAYGPWTIEKEDELEVWGYRVGVTVAASAFVAGACSALLPDHPFQSDLDVICAVGGLGLGASLILIHIYVGFLKRTLQAFWALGMAGFAYLALTQDVPAAVYVTEHPQATWLVGPFFAALTGVAFKEGLCYGKAEAAGLFGAVPLLLAGHLFGILPPEGEQGLLAAVAILLSVFAVRKYTQAVKDDLGDKSVFEFLSKSPEEQDRLQAERERRQRATAFAGQDEDEL